MGHKSGISEIPSPWWRRSVIFVLIFGFTILIGLAANTYKDAPPIPSKVVGLSREILFTGKDILAGQQVFLKHGLMENGSIWGHGAYLGPDFSAAYLLHFLSMQMKYWQKNVITAHGTSLYLLIETQSVQKYRDC